jgi:hypothetical protein
VFTDNHYVQRDALAFPTKKVVALAVQIKATEPHSAATRSDRNR